MLYFFFKSSPKLIEKMRKQQYLICFVLCGSISAEERLSWFTKDPKIKKSIFVPDNLPEGKEENRVLPLVFHDNKEYKIELKCFMRGYNASNNPNDYKDARWSYPGFDDSQVDTSAQADEGYDGAVPYKIWTIAITSSAADAGKKWATCEFQQGDFPLSTDFKFLILRKVSPPEEEVNVEYDTGVFLDEKDLTRQVEDDIKRQISEHYNMPLESVTRSGNKFLITVPNEDPTSHHHHIEIPTPTTKPQQQTTPIAPSPPSSYDPITTPITNPIDSTNSTIAFFCKYGSKWMWRTCNKKVGKCPRMGDKAACRQFKVNLKSKTKPGRV